MIHISHDYDTNIVQQDHPALRETAKPITPSMFGSKELSAILDRMIIALEGEPDGVAIACPQIGESWRIFIVHKKAFAINANDEYDHELEPRDHFIVINPEIIRTSKKRIRVPEGCLSVRWLFGETFRFDKATIRYQDKDGKVHTRGASGLMAQIFQHETDHLNGILFHDHAINVAELSEKEIASVKKASEKLRKQNAKRVTSVA
ncbi:MAG TPA: peptide deformylase [Candidatus Paceibacterota bacterium]|nr:peptide deformylase [Candidatus Paceibacterota bacterium]